MSPRHQGHTRSHRAQCRCPHAGGYAGPDGWQRVSHRWCRRRPSLEDACARRLSLNVRASAADAAVLAKTTRTARPAHPLRHGWLVAHDLPAEVGDVSDIARDPAARLAAAWTVDRTGDTSGRRNSRQRQRHAGFSRRIRPGCRQARSRRARFPGRTSGHRHSATHPAGRTRDGPGSQRLPIAPAVGAQSPGPIARRRWGAALEAGDAAALGPPPRAHGLTGIPAGRRGRVL